MTEKGMHDAAWSREQMKQGNAVSRYAWTSDKFVFLRRGRTIENTEGIVASTGISAFESMDHYCLMFERETKEDWNETLSMYGTECVCEVGWRFTADDDTAEDWYLYEVAGEPGE